MKNCIRPHVAVTAAASVALLLHASAQAPAQQITGKLGSPSATTTIDGRYLPPPPQSFRGTVKLNAPQSKPAWPARVVPPKGRRTSC